MHTITLTEDEMMLLEMCLVDTLERLRDTDDTETYDCVSALMDKVTS